MLSANMDDAVEWYIFVPKDFGKIAAGMMAYLVNRVRGYQILLRIQNSKDDQVLVWIWVDFKIKILKRLIQ